MNEVCIKCGTRIESWDDNYYSRGMMCPVCYSDSTRRTAARGCGEAQVFGVWF